MKVFFTVIVLFAIGSSVAESTQGTSARGGLSGYLFLPGSEVLSRGFLRAGSRLDYIVPDNSAGSYLMLPLSVAWGCAEGIEVGGEIPLYLDDSVENGRILGDITAGIAWHYETARGGSALVLRGLLRLPTGQEGRDRGSELILGAATSTTFRLFRLQASAAYVLNGGRNPFEDKISDYMDFSIGGASYVSEDIQIVCVMDATSRGDFGLSGSGILYFFDGVSMFGALRAGLDGRESYSFSAGVTWTGAGF